MTITLKREVEETLEIQVPCFFRSKDETRLIAVLDENTVVSICNQKGLSSITNGELWLFKSDLQSAVSNFHSCTESEFLDKYSEVERSMSLHPILVP